MSRTTAASRLGSATRTHPLASVALALALVLCGLRSVSFAQAAKTSRFAVDSVAAVDTSFDDEGRGTTGVIVDGIVEADLGRGLQAIVRPFAQRLVTGEWNRQVWVAAVRYERPGRVGVRIDGGIIPPPVGLGNLNLRPPLSPTVSQPSSLFQALPALEPGAPRATLLGAVYPYGVSVTVAGRVWDVRSAIIDASPLRARRVFTQPNAPPRFANIVLGGGFSPVVGLRLGASVTHGRWRRAGETADTPFDRDATVTTIEGEYAIRYTKVAGEWTYDRVETQAGRTRAYGWFVQGQHTLSPRWFAAARVERISAPSPGRPAGGPDVHFVGVEPVFGYRVTPDLTFRGGYRARRGFTASTFDHQAVVSAVWWKRWW